MIWSRDTIFAYYIEREPLWLSYFPMSCCLDATTVTRRNLTHGIRVPVVLAYACVSGMRRERLYIESDLSQPLAKRKPSEILFLRDTRLSPSKGRWKVSSEVWVESYHCRVTVAINNHSLRKEQGFEIISLYNSWKPFTTNYCLRTNPRENTYVVCIR